MKENPSHVKGRGKRNGEAPPPRWVYLARSLFVALGLSLLIFGGLDIVERLWLRGLPMETLHLMHKIEGVLCSLVVAGVASWMIIKSSPAFLIQAPLDEASQQTGQWTEAERAKRYAQWFIAMRWLAVLLAAILVFISVQVVGWLPAEVWWPLVSIIACLAALNVLYTILVRRGRAGTGLRCVQVYLDLVILTLLLQFSGGIENPLSMMMIFHVIIGGVLLSRRQCYWIAAAASGLFALLAWAECADLVKHYTLQLYPHIREANGELFHPAEQPLYVLSRIVLQAVVLFLTAYFVTTLAERLRQDERSLAVMAERATAGQQLLEQSLETTGAALRVLNSDLRPYWINRRWQQWFGGEAGGTGNGFEALDSENSPACQTRHDKKIRVTEVTLAPGALTAGTVGTDPHRRIFQVTTAPLLDLSGNVQRIVELAQDITQQKQTQEQMARAGKLAAVGELAGRVAHEVNNPIAIISTKSRLLLADHGGEMSPRVAQELGKITDYSDRVARIAQGLLSYCRPSPATRTLLDMRQPLRKSLAMVEQHARNSGVTILDELPAELPRVKANAHELEQIFLNLFLNALDAMPKGGRLQVSAADGPVRLRDGQPAIAVVVADTGPGIPETIRDRVFEPFFTTKPEGRGTGLGLSICLGLVRSHGGEIGVESEPGKGSRFIVKLPATTVPAAPEQIYG
ncbi:MAG: PAS domain-containing protein [Verrucomicrobiota bacterium]|nr:PAS domain-containing protein [Verrucomicrobiota bacterium]